MRPLGVLRRTGLFRSVQRTPYQGHAPDPDAPGVDLVTRVGRVTLPNPVMTASGTAGLGAELAPYFSLSDLGATVVKSLSVDPWAGNPAPRLYPLTVGLLNSVGLQNPGVAAWGDAYLPALAATGARVVASIWASSVDGYRRAAADVAAVAATPAGRSIIAVEANISCPNVEDRQRMFAHSQSSTEAAIAATVEGLGAGGLPVWAKLSPNVTDLPAIAGAALSAGADALTLVNTLMGLALDPTTGRARLGQGGGGLSGPALHPIAVRAVFECRRAFPRAAIIGVGGVVTGEDTAEMLAAGADAVQVGTATFANPRSPLLALRDLQAWCALHDIHHIDQLRGRSHE
jgi:dihydroorotate dehydrogenase (NAD+) catalytic subunit